MVRTQRVLETCTHRHTHTKACIDKMLSLNLAHLKCSTALLNNIWISAYKKNLRLNFSKHMLVMSKEIWLFQCCLIRATLVALHHLTAIVSVSSSFQRNWKHSDCMQSYTAKLTSSLQFLKKVIVFNSSPLFVHLH